MQTRKEFLKNTAAAAIGLAAAPSFAFARKAAPAFTISLAEWSLHTQLFAKQISNLDFPRVCREKFGIGVAEYVNQFFKDKANDTKYLADLLQRCKDNGVKNHLIMIDGEGELGSVDKTARDTAVENHYKWVDAATYLGCATIRVNAAGKGSREEVAKAATEGLIKLGEFAGKSGINVIVENHGGFSSDGGWLSGVLKGTGRKNIGALPDFGNFCITRNADHSCKEEYDRYQGTKELMPYAKGVSAKSLDFDEAGNCVETDYNKMLKILKDANFNGYVGIEYEGSKIGEEEGIIKTKALLEKTAKAVGYKIS
ncbi:MAG: TIM barrel protein [Gemmatimonadaceae bacterium]|nr:TIM barrel protein [Chitinophagaceae bacterium]